MRLRMAKTGMFRRALACMLPPLLLAAAPAAWAGPVENRIAVFSALDKITGEITTLRVPVDEVARFGTFRIRPRTCHTRPPTEEPRTMAFIEIDEVTYDHRQRRIFSGWMNAESPGLHAVEHPLFDVWLSGCDAPMQQASGGAPNTPSAARPPLPAAPGRGDAAAGAPARNKQGLLPGVPATDANR